MMYPKRQPVIEYVFDRLLQDSVRSHMPAAWQNSMLVRSKTIVLITPRP
jgi:hypothetical protein